MVHLRTREWIGRAVMMTQVLDSVVCVSNRSVRNCQQKNYQSKQNVDRSVDCVNVFFTLVMERDFACDLKCNLQPVWNH